MKKDGCVQNDLLPETSRTLARSTVTRTIAASCPVQDKRDLDITLFVACYNEEENIVATLEELVTAMAGLDRSWEVIIIDDASTDRSVPRIKYYMSGHPDRPIILVQREVNQGLAQNFVDAAFLGRGKYYRLINGDNVEDHRQIALILRHIGEADMLIPTHRQGPNRNLFRRVLSHSYTGLVNMISGYRIQYYNGCCVHVRFDVLRWHSKSRGFDFQADLITRLLDRGRSYKEIPTVCGERPHGSSKALTLKNSISAALFFLGLMYRRLVKISHGKKAKISEQMQNILFGASSSDK